MQDIAVLSLGTGTSIKPAMVHQEFAGQGSWLLLDGPLMEVLTGGSQELGTSLETIDMLAVSICLLTSVLASHTAQVWTKLMRSGCRMNC